MRIAAVAVVLLLAPLAVVPTASAELECGWAERPCEVGPCAEVYQDGSAWVVDPGSGSCYEQYAFDTGDDWLAWTAAVIGWTRDVLDWVECGMDLECPSPGNPPQDPAGIL